MTANGTSITTSAALEMIMSIPRFTRLLNPCSGTSLMLMTGTPSRSSRRARSAITWSRSGTTLTSTHSQLARARNQYALEADSRLPPPLECVADGFARRKRQQHVEHEENHPRGLRHFECAPVARGRRREVDLDVGGGHDAEDDGQDAADEDREEIIHP